MKMKTIIAGTRDLQFDNEWIIKRLDDIIDEDNPIILSGVSGNVDLFGKKYAEMRGYEFESFPANWLQFGNAAGPIRNQEMVNEADRLILIWDGFSKGSKDILKKAIRKRLIIDELIVDGRNN